jgi:hypothetical protein
MQPLKYGMQCPDIAMIQLRFGQKPTQYFDHVLDKLVRDFQSTHGLVADGVVGSITWVYLNLPRLPHESLFNVLKDEFDTEVIANLSKLLIHHRCVKNRLELAFILSSLVDIDKDIQCTTLTFTFKTFTNRFCRNRNMFIDYQNDTALLKLIDLDSIERKEYFNHLLEVLSTEI